MSFKNQSRFTARIGDADVFSIRSLINYKIDNLEDRMKCVNIALAHGDIFYQEYFDKYCDPCITADDYLLSDSNVVQSLEAMANYILAKDPEYNSTEESYFVREQRLERKINREDEFDGTDTSMIDGLEDDPSFIETKNNQNFKKSKKQSIKSEDFKRDDELGFILRDYNNFLELIAKYTKKDSKAENRKADTFTYKKHQGAIKDDMIICKDSLMRTHGYTLKYFSESTCPNYDVIDLTNINHLLGGWVEYSENKTKSNGLLSFTPTDDYQDDFNCIIVDVQNLINKIQLTELEENTLELYRFGLGIREIGRELDEHQEKVNRALTSIAKKVSEKAKELY